MNENELLLLGMLISQSQHGYQINEFIERELSHLTNMKKGSAYATLDRLCKEDYVSVRMEQEGNRPQRKVYSITVAGEAQFFKLLRENLSTTERMVFAGDVGLMLLDHLPYSEVAELLSQRLVQLRRKIAEHDAAPKHGHGLGVDLALEHLMLMQKAEAGWLEQTIARLQELPNPISVTQ